MEHLDLVHKSQASVVLERHIHWLAHHDGTHRILDIHGLLVNLLHGESTMKKVILIACVALIPGSLLVVGAVAVWKKVVH